MQSIFQNAKRLISMCLVTLLLVTSTLTIFPTPVRAEGNTTNIDCSKSINPHCGNTRINTGESVAIATGAGAGALVGSAGTLTLISTTGSVAGLGAAGITSGLATIGATIGGGMAAGVVLTAGLPLVATAAGAYGVYAIWENFSDRQDIDLQQFSGN